MCVPINFLAPFAGRLLPPFLVLLLFRCMQRVDARKRYRFCIFIVHPRPPACGGGHHACHLVRSKGLSGWIRTPCLFFSIFARING